MIMFNDLHVGDLTTLGLLSWMASLLWQDLDKVSKTIIAPLTLSLNVDKQIDT